MKRLYSVLVVLSLFLFTLLFTSSVFAIGKPGDVALAKQDRMQKVQARLTEAKLKSCQAREDSIKKRSDQLSKTAGNMLEKFDVIEKRVQDYYTSKVVPSGKTVANYDNLVTDVQTKKAAAQTALTTAQTNVSGFTCTGDDPKGQLTQLRTDMQSVKTALKGYRTSIKNLIVAVHSVTGETERSISPKPTKTGEAQ